MKLVGAHAPGAPPGSYAYGSWPKIVATNCCHKHSLGQFTERLHSALIKIVAACTKLDSLINSQNCTRLEHVLEYKYFTSSKHSCRLLPRKKPQCVVLAHSKLDSLINSQNCTRLEHVLEYKYFASSKHSCSLLPRKKPQWLVLCNLRPM